MAVAESLAGFAELFAQARRSVAQDDWAHTEALLREARQVAEAESDLGAMREVDGALFDHLARQHQLIPADVEPESVDLDAIRSRDPHVLLERFDNAPQSLLVLRHRGVTMVGRKLYSELWRSCEIDEPFCSQVTADMLLGIYAESRVSEDGVSVFFHPATPGERRTLFAAAAADASADLSFPWPQMQFGARLELRTDPDGWALEPDRLARLDVGETELRAAALRLLERVDLSGARVFDPACATGALLRSIKDAHPRCTAIGQDLSREAVDAARKWLDEAHVGDAIDTPVPERSIDLMLLRFLNAEVVTTRYAHRLFRVLVERVKPGGQIILYGHTPVLLSSSLFAAMGLQTEQRTTATQDQRSIFQFYALRRPADVRNVAGLT